jgi:hypothetical protein
VPWLGGSVDAGRLAHDSGQVLGETVERPVQFGAWMN